MRRSTAFVVPFALAVLLAGCTSGTPDASSSPATPASSAPASSAPVSPSTSATPSPSASVDPTAPEGQCADDVLSVQLSGGDAGAGSIDYRLAFTNNGTTDCVLAGAPGVSVVGNGDGSQVGEAATQDETADPASVTLPPGGTATADLRSINIEGGGGALGDACPTTTGDGYRVFPPHSFNSIFIDSPGVPACTGTTPWLTVSAVE